MVATLLAIAALLAVVFLLRNVRRERLAIGTVEELMSRSMPVDLECFRNLVDRREEEYLKANLPRHEFRSIQRARMRASLEYVQRTSHNAALLLRIGENARHHSDANIARAGEELVQSALQLRVYSVLTSLILYARILAPAAHISPASFVDRYERLRDRSAGLARLQVPGTASRVEAAL